MSQSTAANFKVFSIIVATLLNHMKRDPLGLRFHCLRMFGLLKTQLGYSMAKEKNADLRHEFEI